ncbi:CoA-binding domain-containing protein [Favolaschia claudopus]|uniref:CoA-binding domain-containing protein n=1 Tax=Favolaschia claudopus TaxID=2862362 RepID=A0AAW0DMH2_9AGAR
MLSNHLTLLCVVPALFVASKASALLESNTKLFLSAPSFAVVGASNDESKFGTIVFKAMLEHGMDVVPVNPFVAESHGISCLHSLDDIVDPAHTSISIVTQPSVTLQILRQASALGIFAVWLQPGAEDDAVLEFIASPNATARGTSYIHSAEALSLEARKSNETPPCLAGDPAKPDLISTLARRG